MPDEQKEVQEKRQTSEFFLVNLGGIVNEASSMKSRLIIFEK